MKISEVMKATGLTKKAIYYYEAEGLVSPQKDRENNYRIYSQDDVDRLIQISVFRKLDIPLDVIHRVLDSHVEVEEFLKSQLAVIKDKIDCLHRNQAIINIMVEMLNGHNLKYCLKEFEALNNRLMVENRSAQGYLLKELDRLFPGKLGKMFSIFYAQFLDEPLDSQEKVKAWEMLVGRLDAMDEIEYPEDIKRIISDYYDKLTDDEMLKLETMSKETINSLLSRVGAPNKEKVREAQEKLAKYYDDPRNTPNLEDHRKFQQFMLEHKALFAEVDQYMLVLSKRFGKFRILAV